MLASIWKCKRTNTVIILGKKKKVIESQIRIIESFESEGTLKGHLLQLPCNELIGYPQGKLTGRNRNAQRMVLSHPPAELQWVHTNT